jgi:hypothetical protein
MDPSGRAAVEGTNCADNVGNVAIAIIAKKLAGLSKAGLLFR